MDEETELLGLCELEGDAESDDDAEDEGELPVTLHRSVLRFTSTADGDGDAEDDEEGERLMLDETLDETLELGLREMEEEGL